MEENQLSSEEAQSLWDEEASKLGADGDTSASESLAAAPETPQDLDLEQAQIETEQPEDP